MVRAGDLTRGLTFKIDGEPYIVNEYNHVKPGKGPAFVKVKVKNLKTEAIVEKKFRPDDKFEKAHIDREKMQYLYSDGDLFHFMNSETYEQIAISNDKLGDALKFINENDTVNVMLYEGEVIDITPPQFVELKIIEAAPNFKGDTASGAMKKAKVETGETVRVPMFIEVGDVIKLNTETEEYIERV